MKELPLLLGIDLNVDINGKISFVPQKVFILSEMRNQLIKKHPEIVLTGEHSFEIIDNKLMIKFYNERE